MAKHSILLILRQISIFSFLLLVTVSLAVADGNGKGGGVPLPDGFEPPPYFEPKKVVPSNNLPTDKAKCIRNAIHGRLSPPGLGDSKPLFAIYFVDEDGNIVGQSVHFPDKTPGEPTLEYKLHTFEDGDGYTTTFEGGKEISRETIPNRRKPPVNTRSTTCQPNPKTYVKKPKRVFPRKIGTCGQALGGVLIVGSACLNYSDGVEHGEEIIDGLVDEGVSPWVAGPIGYVDSALYTFFGPPEPGPIFLDPDEQDKLDKYEEEFKKCMDVAESNMGFWGSMDDVAYNRHERICDLRAREAAGYGPDEEIPGHWPIPVIE